MNEQNLSLSGIHDCGGIAHDAMKIGWAIEHLQKEVAQSRAGELRFEIKAERRYRDERGNTQREQILYDTDLVEPDDGDQAKVIAHVIAALVEHKAQLEADLKSRLELAGLKLAEKVGE